MRSHDFDRAFMYKSCQLLNPLAQEFYI